VPQIQINAPAKINLHLKVGNRRADGFHDIESLFLALNFGDTLNVGNGDARLSAIASAYGVDELGGAAGGPTSSPVMEKASRPNGNEGREEKSEELKEGNLEISMDWEIPGFQPPENIIPLEKNIIFKAVSLFKSRTGYDENLKIAVTKRIPPGSGLGGGSSDAAAALLALNRLASPGGKNGGLLDNTALSEMGAELGSDIPFFLNGACAAWVSGRGERVQPVDLHGAAGNLSFVLVNPGFSSDTAEAYHLLDTYRLKNSAFASDNRITDTWLDILKEDPHKWPFSNDFLPVLQSPYGRIISMLRELGAGFAGLSGSGSTCFGVFYGREKAGIARETLLKQWPFIIETFPLAN